MKTASSTDSRYNFALECVWGWGSGVCDPGLLPCLAVAWFLCRCAVVYSLLVPSRSTSSPIPLGPSISLWAGGGWAGGALPHHRAPAGQGRGAGGGHRYRQVAASGRVSSPAGAPAASLAVWIAAEAGLLAPQLLMAHEPTQLILTPLPLHSLFLPLLPPSLLSHVCSYYAYCEKRLLGAIIGMVMAGLQAFHDRLRACGPAGGQEGVVEGGAPGRQPLFRVGGICGLKSVV